MRSVGNNGGIMRRSVDGYLSSIAAIGLLRTWLSCLTVVSREAGVGIPCDFSPTIVQAAPLVVMLLAMSLPLEHLSSKLHRGPFVIAIGLVASTSYFMGILVGELGAICTGICIGFFPLALAVWGKDNRCGDFITVVARVAFSFFFQYLAYATIVFLPQPARLVAVGVLPVVTALLLLKPPDESPVSAKTPHPCMADAVLLVSMALCAAGHGVLASVSPEVGPIWYLGTPLMGALLILVCILVSEGALLRSILFATLLFQCLFIIPALVFQNMSEWIILARSFSYAVSIGLACALGCLVGGRRGDGGTWVCRFMAVFIVVFYLLYLPMLDLSIDPTIRYFVMFFCFVAAMVPVLTPDLSIPNGQKNKTDDSWSTEVQDATSRFGLTIRERTVLSLMVEGFSAEEIALKLVVSKNTVRSQIQSIYRKFNAHSREEVISMVSKQ